ncbi:MAG: hypothetical protein J5764_01565, partial [Bacteroidales bacterium]|nr:hypothetical protein [Bacteroidales bacterium]
MKRLFYILCAGLIVLAAASCQKEFGNQNDGPVSNGELTTVTISAMLVNGDDEARTTLDTSDGSVSWKSTDRIKVVWNGGSGISEDNPDIDGDNATFTVAIGGGDKFAVYPSSIDASYDGSTFS